MKLAVVAALLAFASSDNACNTTSSSSDASTTEAGSSTAGGQCTRIETAFCQRAIDCLATSQSLSQCIADGNAKCCSDKCGSTSTASDDSVASCVAAVHALDCNSVATGVTPPACAGIPK